MQLRDAIQDFMLECKVRRLVPRTIDNYKAEFEAVIEESKATNMAYAHVLSWFKKTFPHYGKQPERDTNLKIVNTPVNYDAEAAA